MISQVIEGIINLLGPVSTLSKERRELKDSALRSISTALDETYIYFRDLDKGGLRNLEREAQLSKYWSAAAIPIRHFNEELAFICDQKSEYWVNPEHYNPEQIGKLGIELGEVRTAYRRMLYPKFGNK